MLFSSFVFIFAFLPLALVTFYGLRRLGRTVSMWVLAFASLGFYAWWNPSRRHVTRRFRHIDREETLRPVSSGKFPARPTS